MADFKNAQKRLDASISDLERLFTSGKRCMTEKMRYESRIESSKRAMRFMQKAHYKYANDPALFGGVTRAENGTLLRLPDLPGSTRASPAETCAEVARVRGGAAASGFYWILHKCGTAPIRAFCDFENGGMYYVWNANRTPGRSIKDKVETVEDVRYRCAELGLEPFVATNTGQLKAIAKLLMSLGYDMRLKSAVPLAADYECSNGECSGDYRDLRDGSSELTDFLEGYGVNEPVEVVSVYKDAAGLGYGLDGAFYFDMANTDIQALICSTNNPTDGPAEPHVQLKCADTFAISPDNSIFQGEEGTSYLVSCPKNCLVELQKAARAEMPEKVRKRLEEKDEAARIAKLESNDSNATDYNFLGLPEGSYVDMVGQYVYPPETPPCLAAIYEGLYNPSVGGKFTVAVQAGKKSFKGDSIITNGVKPIPLEEEKSRSYIVVRDAKDCPIEAFAQEAVSAASAFGVSFRQDSLLRADYPTALVSTSFISSTSEAMKLRSVNGVLSVGEAFQKNVETVESLMLQAESEVEQDQLSGWSEGEKEGLVKWMRSREQIHEIAVKNAEESCEKNAESQNATDNAKCIIPTSDFSKMMISHPYKESSFSVPIDTTPQVISFAQKAAKAKKSTYVRLDDLAADAFANGNEDLAIRVINQMTTVAVGMDPSVVDDAMNESARVLTQGRGIIKPAVDLYRTQNLQVFIARQGVEESGAELGQLASQMQSVSKDAEMERRMRIVKARANYKKQELVADSDITLSTDDFYDFGMFDLETLNIPPLPESSDEAAFANRTQLTPPRLEQTWKTFIPSLNLAEGGPPLWSYAKTSSRARVIVFEGRGLRTKVDQRANPGVGAYLGLIERRWYDFDLVVHVKPQTSGRMGIGFRFKSPFQTYVFEITQMARFTKVKILKKSPSAHNEVSASTPKIDGPGILLFEATLALKLSPASFYQVNISVKGNRISGSMWDESKAPNAGKVKFTASGMIVDKSEPVVLDASPKEGEDQAVESSMPLLTFDVVDEKNPLRNGAAAVMAADVPGPVFFDQLRVTPTTCTIF
eukprot:GDKJ01014826.1.p1 GENE.GDKJ01014826.1~~GDKJ01014826.1.p1  ORF type:complete len:1043 (-),score=276.90 GDKJ01014826.1:1405-4533(-)